MANIRAIRISIPPAKPQGSKNAYMINGKIVMTEAAVGLKKARQQASDLIAMAARSNGWERLAKDASAQVLIAHYMERPKTVTRKNPTVKPDLDKIVRYCLDAITQSGAVWQDDAQVVWIYASKQYAEIARTDLEIRCD